MNGLDLDKKMREILAGVTRETVLTSTAALVELGFGSKLSYQLVEKVLTAKEKV